jgi:1,2-phenylacetyl-CoA epoxidase catalytic subunit
MSGRAPEGQARDRQEPARGNDVHALSPEDFRDEVHSFQFWFDAVQGYLEGTEHGRPLDVPEAELDESERERLITVLCNYCIGETAALEGAGGLIQIAPNRASKIFLATQTVDEGRHLEVLVQRLKELGVEDPEGEIPRRASPSLVEFKQRLIDLVRGRDWVAAVFAQNVILESMEFAAFHHHAQSADARTQQILQRIIKDERRHIGFGENELGRRLREAPFTRDRLSALREELDALVLRSFQETMAETGVPRSERREPGRHYLQAVERLGFA